MERKEIERDIVAGPQLDEEGLRRLPDEGFTAVVDLRNEKQNGIRVAPDEEARLVTRLDLAYTHIPLDWRHLDYAQADRFRAELDEAQGPVYVHSRRGDLAAAMVIVDRAVRKGWDPKKAVRTAEEMGVIRAGTRADDFISEYVAERVGTRLQS